MEETTLVRITIDTSEEIVKQMHRLCFNTRKSTVALAVKLLQTYERGKRGRQA